MRGSGILKPPSKMYVHLALTEEDLEQTAEAFRKAAKAAARAGG